MVLSVAAVCIAMSVYHEARSDGYDGMAMVALTTLNRANHVEEVVCDHVFSPYAYSWTNGLLNAKTQQERAQRAKRMMPKERNAWEAAKVVAYQALNGQLDSEIVAKVGNANHYYNPKKANPSWPSTMEYVARVGDHKLYYSPYFRSAPKYEIAYSLTVK